MMMKKELFSFRVYKGKQYRDNSDTESGVEKIQNLFSTEK